MSNKELFFLAALIAALYFLYAAFKAIQQCDEKIGLEKDQKNFLYSVSFVCPLLGFLLTRRLQKLRA